MLKAVEIFFNIIKTSDGLSGERKIEETQETERIIPPGEH